MTNVRMSLSMDPSLEKRLLESAVRNNEKPSPHACKMIETGLISSKLIEDRDRRLTELANQNAELETKLSQISSASKRAERRCAELEARAVHAKQCAAAAENRAAQAERERGQALWKVENDRAVARDRDFYPLQYVSPAYRQTELDGWPLGWLTRGAIGAVMAMVFALVVAPYDSRFSLGTAEVAMGAWGSRTKAATRLHGGPLVGGDTMLSAYVLMNTETNAKRLAACFKRAHRELAFAGSNTKDCLIEIPSRFAQYDIMSSRVIDRGAGKTRSRTQSAQQSVKEAAETAALAKTAAKLGRG